MADEEVEDVQLQSVAIQNVNAILAARQRTEQELIDAKEALRELAERLKLALAAGHLGDWSWQASNDVVTVGPTAAEMFGIPEGPSHTWTEIRGLLHPDDRERARLAVEQSIATHTDYDIEYRVQRTTAEIWIGARGRAEYAEDGSVLGMVGVVHDITRRKRVEEALADETRVLELLNRTGTALTSQLDLQSLVQSVTDAGTQLSNAKFGAFFYNVVDQSGEAFTLFTLSGARREEFEHLGHPRNSPVFNPTFRGESPVRSDDITKDPRYGKLPPHHGVPREHASVRSYLAVPVVSRSGQVLGGLFFGHPEPGVFNARSERLISGLAAQAAVAIDNARLYEASQRATAEREQLLERERSARGDAEQMSALKDEFLATLSHELRTPLSAILGWTQILQRRPMEQADMRRALETIERNARAQTQLIEDLLDMSRITSGKIRLDIQPVEAVAFVEAALETVKHAADARSIRLEKRLDADAGLIAGDPGRLQQVIWNLLSNAIKFTPKGGTVQVGLSRVHSHLEITVADTGIGIPPEFLSHVFERFRQADTSTTREYGGLGIGLSIVKHLIELHGGTVRAHSAGEGLGTRFTVRLPITPVHSVRGGQDRPWPFAQKGAANDFRVADLSGIRIVVVDDEPDARTLVERVLADCGAEVSSASSALEAMALVERGLPALLVSDIGMPEIDGYELLRRVHAYGHAKGCHIPAIALTAFARSEDRMRALRAGFLTHVTKPVDPSELVATVASAVGRSGDVN